MVALQAPGRRKYKISLEEHTFDSDLRGFPQVKKAQPNMNLQSKISSTQENGPPEGSQQENNLKTEKRNT